MTWNELKRTAHNLIHWRAAMEALCLSPLSGTLRGLGGSAGRRGHREGQFRKSTTPLRYDDMEFSEANSTKSSPLESDSGDPLLQPE